MATDEIRNFRSSYYEKVGCNSVEEKKSLSILLNDKIRNSSKLKHFCLSYTVPTAQRVLLWNIILGISPIFKNSTDFIKQQRTESYEDLLRAVTFLQYVHLTKTHKSRIFYSMWLLENRRLHRGIDFNTVEHSFIDIAKVLLHVFDNDVEIYWITKEFYELTKNILNEFPKLKDITQSLLKAEDLVLYNHIEQYHVFDNPMMLEKWYTSCFAGTINECTLLKVWDKICGGSRKIVIFIFLEIVKTFRESIMICNSDSEIKKIVEEVKEEDVSIVNKAIKSWQCNKAHSEIAMH